MACRGSGVRVPSAPPTEKSGARAPDFCRLVRRAQLVAAPAFLGDGMQRVRGPSPLSSTNSEVRRESAGLLSSGAQGAFGSARWHHVFMPATDVSPGTTPAPISE